MRSLRPALSARRHPRLRGEPLEPRYLLSADLVISEFVAINQSGLQDEDGDYSDWLEIYNGGTTAAPLDGLYLTDLEAEPTKWPLPAIELEPGGYLVVFASNKDRRDAMGELHTNFAISGSGEYLALIDADGQTVIHEYAPFPQQYANVSYGLSQQPETLLDLASPATFLVPTAAHANLGSTWTAPEYPANDWTATVGHPRSTVLITEAHTSSPDYLEIQNVAQTAVDTTGWLIAVNNGSFNNVNSVHSTKWSLPSSIGPGQVLYRTDSSSDNYWGANISWNTSGSGWVMLLDSEGNIADFVAWGYSAGALAGMSVTIAGHVLNPGGAWSGNGVAAGGNSSNSLQRVGNADSDTAADFAWQSPPSKGLQNAQLVTPFSGTVDVPVITGLGFGLVEPGFTVRHIHVIGGTVGQIGTTTTAENLFSGNYSSSQYVISTDLTGQTSVINYGGGVGSFAGDLSYLDGTTTNDLSDFAMRATAIVTIPVGSWTIGFGSDDGGLLRLAGVNFAGESGTNGDTPGDDVLRYEAPRAHDWTSGQFTVTGSPLTTQLEALFYERSGGDSWEIAIRDGYGNASYVASGTLLSNGALSWSVVTPSSVTAGTDVSAYMQQINASLWTRIPFQVEDPDDYESLLMQVQYNDGFVAYLNGQEVARRHAPTDLQWNSAATQPRTLTETAQFESINLTAFRGLLRPGENWLAVHGLNIDAADENFAIAPKLLAGTTGTVLQYFSLPTPGTINSSGFVNFAAAPAFSVPRGFYEQSFSLSLSSATPEATIRYTLDGQAPTETTGSVYAGPIQIAQTTVVRAAAFRPGYQPSPLQTHSYMFLADVLTQSPSGQTPPGFPSGPINGQILDYGMDPDIVNHATWGPQLMGALTDIPSISLVTDADNLFHPSTGIYVNASQRGPAWERPTSIELIDPQGGEEGFQVNAGLRIRGGYSRSGNNPKHAFRLFFRNEYGAGKLNYPLFGDEGAIAFDNLDLRTAQNYSWSFDGSSQNVMNRDVFARDAEREMGQAYTRSRYYHLYINGHYWGLFQSEERPESSYAASYFGGDPAEWDTVKSAGSVGGYTIEATDGTLEAWRQLWDLANTISYAPNQTAAWASYQQAQGRNPDGSRNPQYPVLLDVDNLIEYMLVTLYSGNKDAPISAFLSNERTNNWFGVRRRGGEEGFRFLQHDAEHTLLTGDVNINRNGPWSAGYQFQHSNPQWIHQQLMAVDEYRLRFADLTHEHMFQGGVLSPEGAIDLFTSRAMEMEQAIVAESARWGDSKVSTPYTKQTWQNAVNAILRNYLPQRTQIVLQQFRSAQRWTDSLNRTGLVSAPLYPALHAPVFNHQGGQVADGFELTISAPSSTVWYTTDGSDPRLVGGAISATAQLYHPLSSPPIVIEASTVIKARSYSGGSWSALNQAEFYLAAPAVAGNLAVTEIQYNPHPATDAELALNPALANKELLEFIELQNVGDEPIELGRVQFTAGVSYDFTNSSITTLAPGDFLVVAKDLLAFTARYGSQWPVVGPYDGQLANGGESLLLVDRFGETIQEFSYDDAAGWPLRADGAGSSLEVLDPQADYDVVSNWRDSSEYGGSPGYAGRGAVSDVVINELLANTAAPQIDAVELWNTSADSIDVSGWWLSDALDNLFKYQFPAGTVLQAGAFLVLDEEDFNRPEDPFPFALSSLGESLHLLAVDAQGQPLRFADSVQFPASALGEAWGRFPDGFGPLAPLSRTSLNRSNGYPRVGPIVISEFNYHPSDPSPEALVAFPEMTQFDLEFVEIHNPTTNAISLADWRLDAGIGFDFPVASLAANEVIVVVSFDPDSPDEVARRTAFRLHYGIGPEVRLLGPFSGRLENAGERLELQRPGIPDPADPTNIPQWMEDGVEYDDQSPWDPNADGQGLSLHRTVPAYYGDLFSSWAADSPSPGSVNFAGALAGDFTGDNLVDDNDIDLLLDQLRRGTEVTYFDLDQDGTLATGDVHYLLNQILGTLMGDANLDGAVDVSDFNVWNTHRFAPYGGTWRTGDFSGDAEVDVSDFGLWNGNKFQTCGSACEAAQASRAQPEPGRELPLDPPPAAVPVGVPAAVPVGGPVAVPVGGLGGASRSGSFASRARLVDVLFAWREADEEWQPL